MKKLNAYAIVDLQYGSTGKGALAGYLAKKFRPDAVVCAFGPNAGHTFITRDGTKFVHVMMPMGAFSPGIKRVFIGPGAVVHPELLQIEHESLVAQGFEYDLCIHENAAVVLERHREAEGSLGRIGSTQKGTGAALAEKITRAYPVGLWADGNEPARLEYRAASNTAAVALKGTPLEGYVVSVPEYNDLMDKVSLLQIEGAQGFSLSVHHGFYPYITSRDCTVAQLLSDCAVPLHNMRVEVFGTARTFPIRVNNKTGSSGPCYHDQEEIKWESVGVEPELTTVTRLPRRIFTFSMEQVKQATRMNGVDRIFLNFCNYMPEDARTLANRIQGATGVPVQWLGWGPREDHIAENGEAH